MAYPQTISDGRTCVSCFSPAASQSILHAVPCGHVFCESCIFKRCSLALKDRTLIPAHCCGLEFPTEYVKEALGSVNFTTYSRFLHDRQWKGTTLRSDVQYAAMVKRIGGMQCPRCGVGVTKISGCETMTCLCGNQFLYLY
ncbi:uncharacterized protein PITG_10078 [Phytophthora infestans T30-4]|uniref:Uncharacterized protein n=2 Tax=Phytophthora infestans TaxID=4787 RepID=D0NE90_PHYIT|nr:uncharacterized protein PITG_10078 [Phytophthora infestans T30-4]EEY56535.1 conserved hypothetical protein [Phytophthora infestans T30-4]KAF4042510.1 C3HC4 type (RING finger) zinc finger protein [Phytophthora infestans]KAF4150599.1 C3HC4 type zinc finger [Phytophthora infestans]|eukprot:XP_002902609.1 conserved hypothetical protein [Phytophthora infestans T30-4]